MYHILLSLIAIGAPLDCDHASELIDSARNNPDKSEQLEITRVVIAHTDPMCFKDAKADWRNGCQSPITLGENQMAQVTYRGVKYDTNDSKTQQTNKVDLVYRGVKLEKELVANKWC